LGCLVKKEDLSPREGKLNLPKKEGPRHLFSGGARKIRIGREISGVLARTRKKVRWQLNQWGCSRQGETVFFGRDPKTTTRGRVGGEEGGGGKNPREHHSDKGSVRKSVERGKGEKKKQHVRLQTKDLCDGERDGAVL